MANDLLVKIAADASEFQDTLAGLGEKLTSTIAGLNPIAAGVIGVVGGIGIAAVSVAEEWEDAFHTIQQQTGASGDALEGLKADWEAVFKTGDQDAAAVAEAVSGVHRALGLTGEQLQVTSRNFLDLAGITGEKVEPLIKATTQAFNDWKISGDKVGESQDFLMRVFQATGTSVTEISNQMAQSGPVLRQMGLDFETSATLIGQLGKVGPGASEAMSGLKKALATMTEAGQPAKGALDSIIGSIKNASSDADAGQKAIEVFGVKAGPSLAAQIREGKFDVDGLTESLKANTTTIADVDNATDGFSDKLTELWNNLQPILVPLGSTLIEAGKMAIDMLTELVRWVGSEGASGAFAGLLEWFQPIADAVSTTLLPYLQNLASLLTGLAVTVIQGALIPVLKFLWQDLFVPLATFLRDVLVVTINTIYGALNSFLEVLSKIPGVSSLFEAGQKAINSVLGETKTKTDDAKASTSALNDTHSTLATTLSTKTHPAVTNVVGALKDKKESTELAKQAAKLLEAADSTLADTLKKTQLPVLKNIYEAQSDVNKARDKANDAATVLAKAEKDLKAKLADSHTSAKDLKSSMDALETAKKNAKTAADNLTKAEGDLTAAQKKNKEETDAQKKAFEDIAKELEDLHVDVLPSVVVGLGNTDDSLLALKTTLADAKTASWDTQKALEDLGITPKEKLKELADTAKEKFDLIKGSGTASATEIDLAQKTYLENLKSYYVQSGQDLPPVLQQTLTTLEGKYSQHKDNVSGTNGIITQMKTNINQSITQLSTDLVKSLWEGDGSFGDKCMSTLKGLGESVTTAFITPATTAISNFISGTIADLLGGKGLGGITDKLSDIGKSFSGIFGNSGSTPSVPTSVPTGGGNNPAGGAASAASGVTGMVTMIAGIGTLISSVIGNFQMAKQETSLNAIEHNTRYTMMYVGERSDGGILGVLFKLLEEASWGVGVKTIQEMRDWVKGPIHDRLLDIKDNTYWSLQKLSNIDGIMTWKIPVQLDQLIAKPWTFTPTTKVYLDGKEIAAYIEDDLNLNGGLA